MLFNILRSNTTDVMKCVDYVKHSRLNVTGNQIIDNGGKKLSPAVIGTYSFIQIDKMATKRI